MAGDVHPLNMNEGIQGNTNLNVARLTNIESNYSRLADSMVRAFKAIEDTNNAVGETNKNITKLNNTLLGFQNEKTNEFVDGYVQKTEKNEDRIIALEKRECPKPIPRPSFKGVYALITIGFLALGILITIAVG